MNRSLVESLFINECRQTARNIRPPAAMIAGPLSLAYAAKASGLVTERYVATQYALAIFFFANAGMHPQTVRIVPPSMTNSAPWIAAARSAAR